MEKPHKRLDAWKLSMDLAIDVYRETDKFPNRERFSLSDQMRRATVSVPSNIAEGAARQTKKEFSNFFHIAQGSLSELDTQIELARRLGFLLETSWLDLDLRMVQIDKMITGLIRHVAKNQRSKE